MLVMNISKHSPESCPRFEAKYRDVFVNAFEKLESLAAKHKVKIVGVWVDPPGHTVFAVYDTPSMENLMSFSKEPEMMAVMSFQTSVMKPLITAKELLAMIKG
jgi:L-rhamnose mutarotase